jgi:hypothetical protein
MIDSGARAASWFLWIAPTGFLIFYAIPLLLWPLTWARWFRWRTEGAENLAIYLGRCTGALAVVVIAACFRAAPSPRAYPIVLEILAAAGLLLTGVHAYGAWRRIQPWTEDVETLLYALVGGVALWLRLGL